MRCTERWTEGVEEFEWADREKKVQLPLPFGVEGDLEAGVRCKEARARRW